MKDAEDRIPLGPIDTLGAIMPGTRDYIPQNRGQHVIHAGGARASYLQLAIKAVSRR